MLWNKYKHALAKKLDPAIRVIANTGVSPSAITVTGPMIASLVCLWFVQTGRVLPFCVAILAAGCLDGLDGMVARAGGRVTKFGGYLDAICDRYFDGVVILAVAYVTGYWMLSLVVWTGALLVSYAKARAALEVPVSNQEWPDLMERGERSVIYLGGLAASAVWPWRPLGHDLFWWTLALLAVLVHATVLQRLLRARRYIEERSRTT